MRRIDYCSTLARESGEPLAGTASHAEGCVVLTYPKRLWARQALDSRGLPERLVRALERLGEERAVGTRLVAPTTPWRERIDISFYPQARRHRDVALEDAAALIETAAADDGEPITAPLILCCTHGVRDRCCAVFGMALVEALREAAGGRVEVHESTHLGGDRFAPTVMVLPSGHMYGHLAPSDAAALIDAAVGGRPLASRFRGSFWREPLEQLAETVAMEVAAQRGEARLPRLGEVRVDVEGEDAVLRFESSFEAGALRFEVRCRRHTRLVVGDCRSGDQGRRGHVSLHEVAHVSYAPA